MNPKILHQIQDQYHKNLFENFQREKKERARLQFLLSGIISVILWTIAFYIALESFFA